MQGFLPCSHSELLLTSCKLLPIHKQHVYSERSQLKFILIAVKLIKMTFSHSVCDKVHVKFYKNYPLLVILLAPSRTNQVNILIYVCLLRKYISARFVLAIYYSNIILSLVQLKKLHKTWDTAVIPEITGPFK